jgi:hypothetical protein
MIETEEMKDILIEHIKKAKRIMLVESDHQMIEVPCDNTWTLTKKVSTGNQWIKIYGY